MWGTKTGLLSLWICVWWWYSIPANAVLTDQQVVQQTDAVTKQNLCYQNFKSCSNMCNSSTIHNTCTIESLSWQCKCTNQSINLNNLDFPIPFYICTMEYYDCYDNDCKGEATCGAACQQTYICGKVIGTPTASPPTATESPTATTTDDTVNGASHHVLSFSFVWLWCFKLLISLFPF